MFLTKDSKYLFFPENNFFEMLVGMQVFQNKVDSRCTFVPENNSFLKKIKCCILCF